MDQLPLHQLRNIATALGIPTVGESAESLSKLIDEATNTPRVNVAASIIDPNALYKHFEEGRFTDCTIRVKIGDAAGTVATGRPAKRLRSGRCKAADTEGPADGEEGVHVIKAHALVLASRSAYFERAMGGEWRESQNRSFEVQVADEQEYVTFRRLIKLCYGTTFVKEGDRDLDFSELVRLIHVANAFECMDAVKQCTVALQGGDLDWEGAIQCIELGELLKGVEGMEELANKAGDVIAKEVGPVDELLVPAEGEDGGDVLGGLRLSAKVKALPPTVFEALLSSEGLQLKTENEAFWLLLSWVEAQSEESEEGKQKLFTRMAKHLQFHSMDPGYILLMVSDHPRIISAGLQLKVVKESLRHSNLARRTHDEVEEFHEAGPSMPPLTRPGERVSWTFNGRFKAADITAIKINEECCKVEGCCKVVGLAAGLPWYIYLCPEKVAEAEAIQAAVYTNVSLPFDWMTYEGGGGFFFRVVIVVGFGTPRATRLLNGGQRNWCEERECGKRFAAWDDVFREGSEWLQDGELCVKVTIHIINDQGPSVSTEVQSESEEEE